MTGVLCWDTPQRAVPVSEWLAISADGAPPGVYVPNMSPADMARWKAKLVNPPGGDARVEIRKTAGGVQVVVAVTRDVVKIAMNGTAKFSPAEFDEMAAAVAEARARLDHELMAAGGSLDG